MKVINTLGELLTAYDEYTSSWDDYIVCLYWREIGDNPLLWQSNLYYKGGVGMIRKSVLDKLKMYIIDNKEGLYYIEHESMIAIMREYKINSLFSGEK